MLNITNSSFLIQLVPIIGGAKCRRQTERKKHREQIEKLFIEATLFDVLPNGGGQRNYCKVWQNFK